MSAWRACLDITSTADGDLLAAGLRRFLLWGDGRPQRAVVASSEEEARRADGRDPAVLVEGAGDG